MVKKWMKRTGLCLVALVVAAGCTEGLLRWKLGLCDAPLSIASDKYEYCFAPNQERMRFGNRVKYNSQCMRCDEVDPKSIKILALGDSVLNGGAFLDQEKIATSLLTKKLTADLGRPVQVLNISAGSWGPDNCNAFLDEKGLFDAKAMVIVFSGFDIQDIMTFAPVVGLSPNMPSKQYGSAIWALLDRYMSWEFVKGCLKRKSNVPLASIEHNKYDANIGVNPGYAGLAKKAKDAGIPVLFYLHPVIEEVRAKKYCDYSDATIQLMKALEIPVIKPLDEGLTEACYFDGIHMSAVGQQRMADIIEPYLVKSLKPSCTEEHQATGKAK